jgi:hypothetical protein
MAAIKNAEELKAEINKAEQGNKDSLYDIAKFKWCNYYQNIHIKAGSEEDQKIGKLFDDLIESNPILNCKIEERVDWEIEKLEIDD